MNGLKHRALFSNAGEERANAVSGENADLLHPLLLFDEKLAEMLFGFLDGGIIPRNLKKLLDSLSFALAVSWPAPVCQADPSGN